MDEWAVDRRNVWRAASLALLIAATSSAVSIGNPAAAASGVHRPVVSRVSVHQSPAYGGTYVEIHGNYLTYNPTIFLGGVKQHRVDGTQSPHSIVFVTKPRAVGTYAVRVRTASGMSIYNRNATVHYYKPASGSVAGWGYANDDDLAPASPVYDIGTVVPGAVARVAGATALAQAGETTFALLPNGKVMAWGLNGGMYGDGTYYDNTKPIVVSTLAGVRSIAAGPADVYALKRDGTLWAWGSNTAGELGVGNKRPSSIPEQVQLPSPIKVVVGGQEVAYALTTDGHVLAWGYGRDGELGSGSTASSTVPVLVHNLANVIAIGDGYALTSAGRVYWWGKGTGPTGKPASYYLLPHRIYGAPVVTRLFTAGSVVFALTAAGQAYQKSYTTYRFKRASAFDNAKQITAANTESVFVLHPNGTVSATGNGSLAGTYNPPRYGLHQVAGLHGVRAIAAGDANAFALMR